MCLSSARLLANLPIIPLRESSDSVLLYHGSQTKAYAPHRVAVPLFGLSSCSFAHENTSDNPREDLQVLLFTTTVRKKTVLLVLVKDRGLVRAAHRDIVPLFGLLSMRFPVIIKILLICP